MRQLNRHHPLRITRLLVVTALLAAIFIAGAAPAPHPALAQTTDAPVFRIDSWSTEPATLTRGGEFELRVKFTNVGSADAKDVIVTVGSGANFVGVDNGDFFDGVGRNKSKTATLRVAVSNTATTGAYSLPIQFVYVNEEGTGTPLTDVKYLGVQVEGLTPPGQDEGMPAFDVVNWSISPEDLQRGQEYDLSVTFTNVGTWDASEVIVSVAQGTNFVGLTESETIPNIQIGEQRTVNLRVAVSNSIVTGYYSIPVQFSYHHGAIGGDRLTSMENLGVDVTGIAVNLGPDYGRPQLVIEDSSIEPTDEEGKLDLTLLLRNVGDRWATRVVVNLGASEYFSPADGSTAVAVEQDPIKLDETATVTFPLTLVSSPAQRISQSFTIDYSSYSGGQYQASQSVPVELDGATAQTPRLLIQSLTTDPQEVTPGSSLKLDMTIANVGAGTAERVFVRLGQDAATLGPLAPTGTGNVQYIDEVPGGAQVDVSYNLFVDGNAEAGLVAIDVEIEYEDAFGVTRTETNTISVQVKATPFFQIDLFEPLPQPIYVGDTFELPIEVINIGTESINVSRVEVESERLRLTNNSVYIGPLDAGTSGTLVADAEALQAGTVDVVVNVNYLDDFQQPQVVQQTIQIDVEGIDMNEEPGANDGSSQTDGAEEEDLGFLQRVFRAVRGFLGLGTQPTEEENSSAMNTQPSNVSRSFDPRPGDLVSS